MLPSLEQLTTIAGRTDGASNAKSIIEGLRVYGGPVGLDAPHRLAQYLAQLAHEAGGFRHDGEVWGPTPAQERYDTRTDLGNSPEKDGDGKLYRGRTGIQITGKANYTAFRDWCLKRGLKAPDFVKSPDLVNTDPWEGLGPIWYWDTRKLNAYADKNDIEMITRRINGGLNGYSDRLRYYTRAALVLLGYAPEAVREFQTVAKKAGTYDAEVDGLDGPRTRAALHLALAKLGGKAASPEVQPAPVVEEKPVAVAAEGSDKRGWLWGPLTGISGASVVQAFTDFPWQVRLGIGVGTLVLIVVMLILGERIIRRTKNLIKEINS